MAALEPVGRLHDPDRTVDVVAGGNSGDHSLCADGRGGSPRGPVDPTQVGGQPSSCRPAGPTRRQDRRQKPGLLPVSCRDPNDEPRVVRRIDLVSGFREEIVFVALR